MKKLLSILGLIFCLFLIWYIPSAIGSLRKQSDTYNGSLTLKLGPDWIGNRTLSVPEHSVLRIEFPKINFENGNSWALVIPPSTSTLSLLSHGSEKHKDSQGNISDVSFFEFVCEKHGMANIFWKHVLASSKCEDSTICVDVFPTR